jgi:hypothetical protein
MDPYLAPASKSFVVVDCLLLQGVVEHPARKRREIARPP